jgi:protein SCO1/2
VQTIKGAIEDAERKDIRVVGISVDPVNDNPKRAASFMLKQGMTGRMEFLLGSREQLQPVWDGFAVQPQQDNLEHSAHTILADANGMQRIGFPFDHMTQEALAHDLGRL